MLISRRDFRFQFLDTRPKRDDLSKVRVVDGHEFAGAKKQ